MSNYTLGQSSIHLLVDMIYDEVNGKATDRKAVNLYLTHLVEQADKLMHAMKVNDATMQANNKLLEKVVEDGEKEKQVLAYILGKREVTGKNP